MVASFNGFLITIGIAAILTISAEGLRSKSIRQPKLDSVWERCVIPGVVALTFDDGPSLRTPDMLDTLLEHNVKATFFINGANYMDIRNETAISIVQRTIDEGHNVVSHTWSHPNLTDGVTLEAIEYQMEHFSNELSEIFNFRPIVMRPPFGEVNQTVVDVVGGLLGYEVVLWSIDTWDWEHPGDYHAGMEEYILRINGTNPAETMGFIALHHDTLPFADQFAKIAIDYVRRSGYRLVTLSECLGIPF